MSEKRFAASIHPNKNLRYVTSEVFGIAEQVALKLSDKHEQCYGLEACINTNNTSYFYLKLTQFNESKERYIQVQNQTTLDAFCCKLQKALGDSRSKSLVDGLMDIYTEGYLVKVTYDTMSLPAS